MAPPSLGSPRTQHASMRFLDFALPAWAHPDVSFWQQEWRTIRDMCEGEHVVKTEGSRYLPHLEGMDQDEYAAYLDRATFYPFTGRTASALSGSIFRRRETMENMPDNLVPRMQTITRDSKDFLTFATIAAEEVIKMGRFGVLVDMPAGNSVQPRPYLVGYTAENIIDWEEGEIDGRLQLVRVVLREPMLVADSNGAKTVWPRYRQLRLTSLDEGRTYVQEVFENTDVTQSLTLTEGFLKQTITPLYRGKALQYLPFRILGAFESGATVDKPPMQDIARLNVSHYRSYAQLEHGRFFTGFPIYYVEAPVGASEDDAEFTLGASRVWQTPAGAKPGILEMNGQGLKFLVDALDIKESQAAALGGRMMGVRSTAVSESDNMLKLSERNEQSVLLKITRSLDAGFTIVLRWWAMLQDVSKEQADKITVEFNKDFLFDGIGAREFRAVHSMYKDGVLPIDVVFHYLKKAMVVPDWMTLTEFKKLLDKMESFPNNADIEARSEGYADAKSRDQEDLLRIEKGLDADLEETKLDHQSDEADKDRKDAEKARKAIANRPVSSPSGTPPAKGSPPPKR